MFGKIKSQKEIIDIARKNKKVAAINGSFDILHKGHIKALQEAKNQADILIVLLNSDKSVRAYKGLGRPINPQKKRAQALAELDCVDFVTIFSETTPKKLLAKIKPDVYCQGKDWGKDCIEREVVEKYGGKVYVLKWSKGFSTSKTINSREVKAIFLDRDGTININEPEYLYKIEDFKFAPYVVSALKKMSKDYKIIVLTNQSGIGRGYFKENDLLKLHQWLLKKIGIDKIYYCPHHPKDNCFCRKPKPGLLLKAVKDFNISLNKSWLIGDNKCDIVMARETNLRSIKIGEKMPKKTKLEPNYYAKNLLEAVKIIYEKGD